MPHRDPVAIIAAAVGAVVCLAVALFQLRKYRRLIRFGQVASGTVVWIDKPDRSSTYYLVVRFQPPQQDWLTARAHFGAIQPRHQEDDVVSVRFDAADPTTCLVEGVGPGPDVWFPLALSIAAAIYVVLDYLAPLSIARQACSYSPDPCPESNAHHGWDASTPLYYPPVDPQDAFPDTPEYTMMPTRPMN